MDIGFGDVVSPCPMSLDYPLLLTNIPSIQIQAYSLETVIAEKFHTMIDRDVSNSRMKDFYDCHQLLTRHHINDQTLYDAICATFDNRQLEYNPDLQLFTPEFAADAKRNVRWNSFLKKINVVDAVTFQETMCVIIDRLYPLYTQYWLQNKRVWGTVFHIPKNNKRYDPEEAIFVQRLTQMDTDLEPVARIIND